MGSIQLEEKLNHLTRKQRKIYEAHIELFDEIFSHHKLRNVDPDILQIIEIEQKEYLIKQLTASTANDYRYMTIKGVQEDVKRTIQNNLDELVSVVQDIIRSLEETKS